MSTPLRNTVGYSSSNRGKFDAYTASILSPYKWNDGGGASVKLTFSFPSGSTFWSTPYGYYGNAGIPNANGEFAGLEPLSAIEQNAVKSALGVWASVAGVRFKLVGTPVEEPRK